MRLAIGGLLVEYASWRWIFFLNLPAAALTIVLTIRGRIEERTSESPRPINVPASVLVTLMFGSLTFALIEANARGWTSGMILGLFALSGVSLGVFVLLEMHQRLPLLDLRLFRNPTFAGSNAVALLVSLAMFGVFFFVSLYMQNVLGYSPTEAGAAFLHMTLLIIVVAPLAGRLSDRLGSRWLMATGMTLVTIHLLLLAQLGADASFWSLLPALMIGGVGMAITMTPMTAAAMSAVPGDKAGVGSGILNTFRQVGGALGIAVMGAIVAREAQASAAAGATRVDAFLHGLHLGLYVAAAIALSGAVIAAVTIRSHAVRRPAGEPDAQPAGVEAA
jgi:EmrB/QacA subfamily drug resistance transporter